MQNESEMKLVAVELLKDGAVIGGDVYDGHTILLRKGVAVTQKFLEGLKRRNVTHVSVLRTVADVIESTATGIPPDGQFNAESVITQSMRQPVLDTQGNPDPSSLREYKQVEKNLYKAAEVESCVDAELLDEVSGCVEDVFQRMTQGGSLEVEGLRAYTKDMIAQAIARPNAAVKLLDVGHFDKYTFLHSINVGLLFVSVGSEFIPPEILEDVALGAVLHDVGKTAVPWELITKPGKLTDEEFEIVKRHPVESERILREYGGFGKEAMDIAYLHHEKWDGTGYPLRLDSQSLSIYAQVAAACDVYDALTTSRSYKQKMDFYTAMGIIVRGSGSHFSPKSVNLLSRRLGLYPVGSFVKLSTNETAIVSEMTPDDLMRPKVKIVYDSENNPVREPARLDISAKKGVLIIRSLTTADMMQLSVESGGNNQADAL